MLKKSRVLLSKCVNPPDSPGGVHDAHRGRRLIQERSPGSAEGFLRAATQRQTCRHQETHQVLWVK